jgi:hypothetical protein
MSKANNIYQLAQRDPKTRDLDWERDFLAALPHANLRVLEETPSVGPDGWPYLMVELHEAGSEPAQKIVSWLSDKGIGLAINPHKEAPDYVLPYGMLWNFRARKEFQTSATAPQLGQVKFDEGSKVHSGAPSDEYLPPYVRQILNSFFLDNQIKDMRVLVMSHDRNNYDLCFSLEALGNPKPEEHREILESISWFMPAHYSLVIVGEKGLPPFHPLV